MRAKPKKKTARLVGGFMRWCDEAILAAHPDRPMRGDDISTPPAPNRRATDPANDHQHTDAESPECARRAATPIDAAIRRWLPVALWTANHHPNGRTGAIADTGALKSPDEALGHEARHALQRWRHAAFYLTLKGVR